ncbi:hypothetical protein CU098_004802, partial [Rhizopus stolonifer]
FPFESSQRQLSNIWISQYYGKQFELWRKTTRANSTISSYYSQEIHYPMNALRI